MERAGGDVGTAGPQLLKMTPDDLTQCQTLHITTSQQEYHKKTGKRATRAETDNPDLSHVKNPKQPRKGHFLVDVTLKQLCPIFFFN